MITDKQGNILSGASANSTELFDRSVAAFNIYRGDPVALLDEAIELTPECAMAHITKAHLYALATEPDATAEAKQIVHTAKTLGMNDREKSHINALDLLLAGEWTAAALALDHHNNTYPHDLVALQCGHLMDFYRANGRNLRDRIARVLPKWSSDMPGYSVLLGMHAFGLEETGDYVRAEDMGRKAIDLQPLDCWAHHAVAHVMEMQGRAEDGIGWMIAREPHWTGDDNFFKVHNWWHRSLFHLELEQNDEALRLYDTEIGQDQSAVALDLVDASALLWRLHLIDHDVGNRWQSVAAAWDAHADGKGYPFNDWHAVMAYLGAGRQDRVEKILTNYRNSTDDGSEVSKWGKQTVISLVEGFVAFWQADYETAVDRLHSARFISNTFGGSHAQRDIIDWTLTEAAIRGQMKGVSESLANERIELKPHSPVNRNFLARAKSASGNANVAA
ncbi:MAG: tetratricopeptide repeat protein [Alphaproteobacteria bacterium]|nr:tetratricopeptide repeat protein [Alphaproteobacteria bacterium]